jgi:hypothetical protein
VSPPKILTGSTWTFVAAASDNHGVRKVELLLGGQVVGTKEAGPCVFDVAAAKPPGNLRSWNVEVRATDLSGRQTTSLATIPVDSEPPVLAITGPGLDPGTNDPNPTFSFSIKDQSPIGSVSCARTGAQPVPSSGYSFTGLARGEHSLRVVVADIMGNETSVLHRFRVDRIAPETTIAGGRDDGARTSETHAIFALASSEPVRTFECRVDAGTFKPCDSTFEVKGLGLGRHTVAVRAVDKVGNVDATPVTRSWTVVADFDGDGFKPRAGLR